MGNAHSESFNSCLRDEFLNREIFAILTEAQVLAEQHPGYHNVDRPHSSMSYLTPAAFTALDRDPRFYSPALRGEAPGSPERGEQVLQPPKPGPGRLTFRRV
jgi:hypothetical protein